MRTARGPLAMLLALCMSTGTLPASEPAGAVRSTEMGTARTEQTSDHTPPAMLDDEPRPGHAGRAGVVDWLAQRDLAETGRQHAGRSLFTVPSRSTLWRFDLSTAGLALLGLAGLCGLAWLVVSRNHSTAGGRAYDQRSYETIAPRAATSAIEDLLQPLIGGTLAIVDEPLVFPPTARIHGQPLPPWRLRAEAAHEGGPPHALSAGAGLRQTPATGASCLAPPHFRESAASSERMEATTGAGR